MFIGISNAVTGLQSDTGLRFLFANGEAAGYGLDLANERYFVDRVRKSFPEAATFSRASTATMVDSTGTLVTVSANEPRIGHHVWNGSEWVNEGLLLEREARTNLVPYSNDFATGWSGLDFILTAAATAGPDGELSATKVAWTADTAYHSIFYTVSVSENTTYTRSVWVKYAGVRWIYLQQYDSGGGAATNKGVWFDVENGLKGTEGAGCKGYITDEGDGWYRCSMAYTTSAGTTSERLQVGLTTGDGVSPNNLLGDGTSGIYIYGAQLEAGPTPSSYIPTSGAQATRAAETLVAPSANLPRPEPEVIGEELVTNGDFSDGVTGWVDVSGAWSVASGALHGAGVVASAYGPYNENTDVVEGRLYRVTFSLNVTSGSLRVRAGNAESAAYSTSGTYTLFLRAITTGVTSFQVRCGGSGFTGSIDNISVKEINPLAVSLQMKGRMTYADTGTFLQVVQALWRDDTDNQIIQYVSGSGSAVGTQGFFQESGGVSDVVDDADTYSPGILVPFNIASRHGSTFINGAVDGTALTEDTTPTALPDLSSTDLQIGYDFMGTISEFRVWAADLGDAGIEEASS